MRAVRAVLAFAVCSVTLVAITGAASAGGTVPTRGALVATCNPSTGDFDVTLTITSNVSGVTVSGGEYDAHDVNDNLLSGGDLPAFNPSLLDVIGATTVVSFTVPGATYDLYTQWATPPNVIDSAEIFIKEPCTAAPRTSTTEAATTVPGEVPTTAAPAVAAAAAPRFTG